MCCAVLLLAAACGACACALPATATPSPDAAAGDWDWDTGSHDYIVAQYYLRREFLPTSNLGAILFKNELAYIRPRTRRFLIYVHRKDNSSRLALGSRHVMTEHSKKLLEGCSVDNCDFVENPNWLGVAEAVLVELGAPLPARAAHCRQRWVLLAADSPARNSHHYLIDQLDGLFNWSMTYRPDADVPVPYGRTVPLLAPATADMSPGALATLVPHWESKQRTVLAAALLSNCSAKTRMNYLNTFKLSMRVHYYGGCFYRKPNEDCPKTGECTILKQYLFYLAFESSECAEYLSQRVFSHALLMGAVPVLLGPTRAAAAALLPPGSFLHARDYASPRDLAHTLQRIAASQHELLRYHAWRRHFAVLNESAWAGAAGSRLCRLCEALNYNARARRVYRRDDLRRLLDPVLNCRNST